MAAGARRVNMGIILTNRNYSQFVLNQYQEVGQRPLHIASRKRKYTKFLC